MYIKFGFLSSAVWKLEMFRFSSFHGFTFSLRPFLEKIENWDIHLLPAAIWQGNCLLSGDNWIASRLKLDVSVTHLSPITSRDVNTLLAKLHLCIFAPKLVFGKPFLDVVNLNFMKLEFFLLCRTIDRQYWGKVLLSGTWKGFPSSLHPAPNRPSPDSRSESGL